MTVLGDSLDLEGEPRSTRVVVAMSGGVDSSVAAALVKAQGYDCIGITLQLYDHGAALRRKGACCAGQDIHDARRVAAQLDIPHYVLDYENRFRQEVMEEFADSYLAGETPIPCVRCNERVKFRDLMATARELGASALVTGHYVRSIRGRSGRELHRGTDDSRDQSYFLFSTTPEQLGFLRFPLGNLPKDETRRLAARYRLKVAAKPDSQDICFVPNGRYADVVARLRPEANAPGDIIHVDGRVLGRHEGVIHYTVGQRRGLGIAEGDPLYVVRLDAPSRTVIVGPRDALGVSAITLREVNWLGETALPAQGEEGFAVLAKVRSTRAPVRARVNEFGRGGASVIFDEGEEGVAPGQACVFYDVNSQGSRVLGGGWIAAAA
jgi:tRNA-specific 2-thiouridylase